MEWGGGGGGLPDILFLKPISTKPPLDRVQHSRRRAKSRLGTRLGEFGKRSKERRGTMHLYRRQWIQVGMWAYGKQFVAKFEMTSHPDVDVRIPKCQYRDLLTPSIHYPLQGHSYDKVLLHANSAMALAQPELPRLR